MVWTLKSYGVKGMHLIPSHSGGPHERPRLLLYFIIIPSYQPTPVGVTLSVCQSLESPPPP